MASQDSIPISQPDKTKSQDKRFIRVVWRWFLEPSPRLTEPDQRRQASLLSGLLLGLIVVSILGEAVTVLVYGTEGYTGYRGTAVAVLLLLVVYSLSRTQRLHLAAVLTFQVIAGAIFITSWADPGYGLEGLFAFLILPLWLASLFFDLKRLLWLNLAILGGLIVFPLVNHGVSLGAMLIGPFFFILTTSVALLIITHNRNQLEQDRQAELAARALRSQREAARAEALLRVAERLNAQLDLDSVLMAISEEVTHAFETPVSIVTLYDREKDYFYAAAGQGLTPEALKSFPTFPKAIYDNTTQELGTVFSMPDLQAVAGGEYLVPFKDANLRSMAFATMKYERELIGSLTAISVGEPRPFTTDDMLLLNGLADQAALAIVNTRLYKDAQRRLERLQALRAIDIAITTNHDLQQTLSVLLNKITEQLKVDAAVFLLLNEHSNLLEFAASQGFHTPALRATRLRLGEGMAGHAALQKKIMHIQDLRSDPKTLKYSPALAREGFASYYAAPLIAQDKVKGVLEVFHRSPMNPDSEWMNFLEALAGQAAIAIESSSLFEDLKRTNDELSQAYDSTIEGWSHALDLRDRETEGHTRRVTEMTLRLARALPFSSVELVHIRRGALLHDIGKMGVPDAILHKPGALSEDEWKIMRQHPQYAFDMLSPIDFLKPALDIPYCHHEKWDGRGYPRGLAGEHIPLAARVFALADVYDALTSQRPYREAWTKERTLEHIRTLAGTHFDPKLVEVFVECMDD